MDTIIKPGGLAGSIEAMPSKSHCHRALVCASLSVNKTILLFSNSVENSLSQDIKATMDCLEQLGAKFKVSENKINVTPISPKDIPSKYEIDCNESGSTLRFLLPVCSVFSNTFNVTGQGRLPERPIDELIDQMKSHGCKIDGSKLPLTVSGPLIPGKYTLPGDISSQYVSGLLFALPLLNGDSQIELTSQLESSMYVDMTIDTLRDFGIHIERCDNVYMISGNQKYTFKGEFNVENDWSNGAFWLTAGVTSKDGVICHGLNSKSLQPDRSIISILNNIGADIDVKDDIIDIKSKEINSIKMDASGCPDLVPIVSIILSVGKGTSQIINAQRLRVKESDRLMAMVNNLKILGAQIRETSDGLIIEGVSRLKGGTVDGYNDHRIVMSMAIASTISENDIKIKGSEAIDKSYPDFFKDLKRLGGKVNVI